MASGTGILYFKQIHSPLTSSVFHMINPVGEGRNAICSAGPVYLIAIYCRCERGKGKWIGAIAVDAPVQFIESTGTIGIIEVPGSSAVAVSFLHEGRVDGTIAGSDELNRRCVIRAGERRAQSRDLAGGKLYAVSFPRIQPVDAPLPIGVGKGGAAQGALTIIGLYFDVGLPGFSIVNTLDDILIPGEASNGGRGAGAGGRTSNSIGGTLIIARIGEGIGKPDGNGIPQARAGQAET